MLIMPDRSSCQLAKLNFRLHLQPHFHQFQAHHQSPARSHRKQSFRMTAYLNLKLVFITSLIKEFWDERGAG